MRQNKLTRHHLIPRERKKNKTIKENQTEIHLDAIIYLWRDKHDAWHKLFKNMCLDEIIQCLNRVKRIKLYQYEKAS